MIEFTPNPTSNERLCAGVVTRTDQGTVQAWCALESRKMEHAFGTAGVMLHDIAEKLCQSLAEYWKEHPSASAWTPPFTQARLAALDRFTALNAEEAATRFLERTSSLQTLLAGYVLPLQVRETGIVERVRSVVKRDTNTRHLATRFNRELVVVGEGSPLKVDFLGQHYACYFLQITRSARGLDGTSDRAFGKLYQLEALRRMVRKPPQSLGLLEDERPKVFELLMVGDRKNSIQRRAIYQIEALADKNEARAQVELTPAAAAERVGDQERLAA